MEDAWANLQKDFCDIIVSYFYWLFACLREVDTMKTRDARSYIFVIKLLSLAGTGDKIFLDEQGHLFFPQYTCVLHSFLLMKAS